MVQSFQKVSYYKYSSFILEIIENTDKYKENRNLSHIQRESWLTFENVLPLFFYANSYSDVFFFFLQNGMLLISTLKNFKHN